MLGQTKKSGDALADVFAEQRIAVRCRWHREHGLDERPRIRRGSVAGDPALGAGDHAVATPEEARFMRKIGGDLRENAHGVRLHAQPYNAPYECMMAAIHIVWAVMLWRASDDPAQHYLFIDFTIWANAAHGLVMLIATPLQKGLLMTVVEGVPLFAIAAVLAWLRPRRSAIKLAIYPKTA